MERQTATVAERDEQRERLRQIWGAGDYSSVDYLVAPVGLRVVERAAIEQGDEVLDLACGSGNATIPAALTGARVTGLDISPWLLQAARRRAADHGVQADLVEGDAESLPFADASFDAVVSVLGVQFTPRQEAAAGELVRVCRPGGRVALAGWTPEGFVGRFLATVGSHVPPPPGVPSPLLWGEEEHVRRLLEGLGSPLELSREVVPFEDESAAGWVDFMAGSYGPLVKAREAAEAEGRWEELRSDLVSLAVEADEGEGAFRVRCEYLLAFGRRAG